MGTVTLPSLAKRLVRFMWSPVTEPTKHAQAGPPDESPLVSFIYLIRNFLTLVPLIFTWYSLSTAASSYQKYMQERPSAVTQPFLLLWQEGFGGKSLPFSQVAFIDAMVLIIFLLLTIISSMLSSREKSRRNQEERKEISNTEDTNTLAEITKNEATTNGQQTVTDIGIAKIAEGIQIIVQESLKELSSEMNARITAERDKMYATVEALSRDNKAAIEHVERQLLTQREDVDRMICQVAQGNSETKRITNTLSEIEKQLLETTQEFNELVEALRTANSTASLNSHDLNGKKEPKR